MKTCLRLLLIFSAVYVSRAQPAEMTTPPAKPAPDMQEVLFQFAKLDPKPIETLTAKQARVQPTPADAVMKVMQKEHKKPLLVDTDDRSIKGPGGNIQIRVYSPKGTGPFPVIVYFHGGGFVIADLDTYDSTPRELVTATNAVVVSAHYRQGPENKFPAAHEDALATYKWVLAHASEIHGDSSKVAVAGESAGGNLAAAVAIMAREQKLQAPVHQLLVYPVTDSSTETPSYQENAHAKPLSKPMMKWFFENAATPADATNPKLVILRTPSLKNLPPATVITAEIDPLRSEGKAFADKLKADGVKVNYRNFEGVTHEFFGMASVVGKAQEAVDFAAADLKTAFSEHGAM